jgi:GNAT superfamily N-acetyltransferase
VSGTPDDFLIRPATAADVVLVLALVRELAEYERLSHAVTATEQSLAESLFGPQAGAEVLLAFESDAPVGFAVFFHNFSTFLGARGLWLEDLYVLPQFRRKGYGRALLLHVARIAHQRRCGRFEWAALDWNTPAVEFYKSLGAVPLGDWTIFRVTGAALDKLAVLGGVGSDCAASRSSQARAE